MSVQIRPAQAQDQATIKQMVHDAHLNPLDLDWQHFLVAEENNDPPAGLIARRRIVGIGQVKSHDDGSRELASLVVAPERRNQGVGGVLVRVLLARESSAVYLMCRAQLEGYYARFGFSRLVPDQMPPFFRRMHRLASVASRIVRRPPQLVVMKRLPTADN